MIRDDNITALERLECHREPEKISPWVVAALLYVLFELITGLGARIGPMLFSSFF